MGERWQQRGLTTKSESIVGDGSGQTCPHRHPLTRVGLIGFSSSVFSGRQVRRIPMFGVGVLDRTASTGGCLETVFWRLLQPFGVKPACQSEPPSLVTGEKWTEIGYSGSVCPTRDRVLRKSTAHGITQLWNPADETQRTHHMHETNHRFPLRTQLNFNGLDLFFKITPCHQSALVMMENVIKSHCSSLLIRSSVENVFP